MSNLGWPQRLLPTHSTKKARGSEMVEGVEGRVLRFGVRIAGKDGVGAVVTEGFGIARLGCNQRVLGCFTPTATRRLASRNKRPQARASQVQ